MPSYVPVSRQRHGAKRWVRFSSYAFASHLSVVPLVAPELSRAVMGMPIAFMRERDGLVPVAVLGVEPQRNLFVAPDGRWIGSYVPAYLRSYPFRMFPASDGRHVLSVDEESGLIVDGPEGEPLLDEDGSASPALKQVVDFLLAVEGRRAATVRICAVLERLGLMRPWPLTVRTSLGVVAVQGLFQVDEAALGNLPRDALEEVRQVGGLPFCYCQLLSMQHAQLLGRLAEVQTRLLAQKTAPIVGVLDDASSGDLEIDWDALGKGEEDAPESNASDPSLMAR